MNKNNLNKDKIDCNGSFTDSLILTANGDINNNENSKRAERKRN